MRCCVKFEYGTVSFLNVHVLYFVKSMVVFQSVFTVSELQPIAAATAAIDSARATTLTDLTDAMRISGLLSRWVTVRRDRRTRRCRSLSR